MSARENPQRDDALGSLIAPVSIATFFARYFEREPLHVARGDATYFRELYSVGCVEDALVLGADAPDHFSLVKDDVVGRDAATSERAPTPFRAGRTGARQTLDPRHVLAAFASGQTLNITDASAFHPPLARLCNRIQTQHGFFTLANAYFTPPGAGGFGIHHDTHDTLIVQIDGEKDWQVYDPVVALPLPAQPFSKAHEAVLKAPRVLRMRPGDSLYIPHGFPHRAVTTQQRSLHLTFAIAPMRVVDLLQSLVQLAALGDVDLRRALPPDWHRDPSVAAQLSEQFALLAARAFTPQRIALAADLAHNDVFAATRTTARGMFDALAAAGALDARTRLRLRDETPFALRERGDRLCIVLAAKVVSVPAAARAAFDRLATGPADYAEIERVLPAGSAADFVRTLVLEGLIDVA